MKALKLGIFGLGTVGSGVVEILTNNSDMVTGSTGTSVVVKKICVRDLDKERKLKVNTEMLTSNKDDILDDPEIDVVVEVMGGIEDSKLVIEKAFKKGKHVISANKDLIALYGKELSKMAEENHCHFFFEAAVAGGIPIIRTLQYSLAGNKIKKIGGIVNGSTNYILTRMEIEKLPFERIIDDAMELGYLEADPSADLDGLDAARKCAILASVGFESFVELDKVYASGIRDITLEDILYAKELGYKIKLLAIAENKDEGVVARVHTALIPLQHPLSSVLYEFNSVYVVGDCVGETMYYGKGAGSLATGSSVVSDIIEIGKRVRENASVDLIYCRAKDRYVIEIEKLPFSYYLRVVIEDESSYGVEIKDIFEKHNIEVEAIHRHDKYLNNKKCGEYVIITKEAIEKEFNKALKGLFEEISPINEKHTLIRIEKGL